MEYTVYRKNNYDEEKQPSNNNRHGSKGKSPGAADKAKDDSSGGDKKGEGEGKQRLPCNCQSSRHGLINNCLSCGKIVCGQEGSGPCLFCGNLVVTNEEQAILDKKNKKSEHLYKKLLGTDSRSQYQAAVDNKNRLLEYQANSAKRTQIIDDESDYFNVDNNRWLTPEQRAAMAARKEELQQEKHKSRLDRKITFDFAGRKVIEEDQQQEYDINKDMELLELFKNDAFSVEAEIKRRSEAGDIVNPSIGDRRPVYDESTGGVDRARERKGLVGGVSRVQDRELMEMSDDGMCLSMHQPWASLLVMGIKVHEGRTWYSQHRGRLWIHAGSKVPSQDEIQELEQFYRIHLGQDNISYPGHYPTSCLLGSVDVTDVLAQEDYQEQHPQGESSSPYVFICTNPQELMIKFPMSGKHKLFKLDAKLHAAAKKTVKKA